MKKVVLKVVLMVLLTFVSLLSVQLYAAADTELAGGNSMDDAHELSSYDERYVSSLGTEGESDWFKFTTKSEEGFYTVQAENISIVCGDNWYSERSVNVIIYDAYNTSLSHFTLYTQETARTSIKLNPDTVYYINVEMGSGQKQSTGNYSVTLSFLNDTDSDAKDEAMPISFNSKYSSSLDGTGDTDWVKFTAVDQKAIYTFSFENLNIDADVYAGIYDVYDKQMVKLLTGNGNTHYEDVMLTAGTEYYIKVINNESQKTAIGNYSLTISYTADNEGDDKNSAKSVETNKSGDYTMDGIYDIDFFAFSTGAAKTYVLSFTNNSVNKVRMKLITSLEKQLSEESFEAGKGYATNFELEPNQKYYISVENTSRSYEPREKRVGSYSFSMDEAKEYTITFNMNGGTESVSPIKKIHNINLTLPNDIESREVTVTYDLNGGKFDDTFQSESKTLFGYFAGWNTAADGSGETYDSYDEFTLNEDTTLYAVWTGLNSLSLPLAVRDGYTFGGWFVSGDEDTKLEDGNVFKESVTIRAKWIDNNAAVEKNETESQSSTHSNEASDSDESNNALMYVIIAVIVLGAGVAIFFVLKKEKNA